MAGSFVFLLVVLVLASPLERGAKPVETPLPDRTVPGDELGKLPERLRAQGIEPAPALGPDGYEIGVLQDRQLPRNTRLTDVDDRDQLVDGSLARAQSVDDPASGGIGQNLKHVGHADILPERHISRQQYFKGVAEGASPPRLAGEVGG